MVFFSGDNVRQYDQGPIDTVRNARENSAKRNRKLIDYLFDKVSFWVNG